MARDRLVFTRDQRRRLLHLGLIGAQIDELEKALPLARAILRPPAPLQDVRWELRSLHAVTFKAVKKIERLIGARVENRALFEAKNRVLAFSEDDGHETMVRTLSELNKTRKNLELALQALPRVQRRNAWASRRAIGRIDQALLDGFVRGHRDGAPLPTYKRKLRRSSSPRSAFREIVGVCYAAMGQANTDPERAIKAFIGFRRNMDSTMRAVRGVPDTKRKRRGRPRKIGR